jgi:hypothetical protein
MTRCLFFAHALQAVPLRLAPATVGAFYLRKTSGSLAIFAAIRRASSTEPHLSAWPVQGKIAERDRDTAPPTIFDGNTAANSRYQTPSDGTKQRILYFESVLTTPSLYSDRFWYQTIASPTGFAVLITASDGIGYHSPSMGTQY